MAPITITFSEDANELIEQLDRRQKDIQDFQIPRLRDYKGSLAGQQEYAADLREDSLELLIDDQPRQRIREQLAVKVEDYKKTLEQLRNDMRVALLTSKRTIDSMSKSNREELFRSSVMKEKKLNEKANGSLMDASNDVTEALQRTMGLMQGELERSVLSVQMLDESSANLRSATLVHDNLTTLLDTSKYLIVALQKSDWVDRLLLFGALFFFFMVVLFILKQRVLDRTFRAAFWWTRFLPNFTSSKRPLEVPTSAAQSVVSTLVETITSEVTTTSAVSTIVETIISEVMTTISSTLEHVPDVETLIPIPIHEEL
ncbi:hypothetical protein Clacol_005347 [Clathrus columnatus]|uniref:Sec20 C-terminal domain-containing protein n=1 Tax=Clathrus columnatus TaxID=1419009 RepID=A0AAV5A910_9AGAM|nr:hypothetical protein Clacol_005347 [Clathrus columnatus]